ncbi:MAG: phosphate acetyltransferase [Aliishimia sp.]
MKPLENLMERASRLDRVIALSEGTDARVIEAAINARRQGIARIALVGDQQNIERKLAESGAQNLEGITLYDPNQSTLHQEMAEAYHALRAHKGMTSEQAAQAVRSPHIFAALLVKLGYAHGTLGGATTATSEIVRTALQVIGTASNATMVSSFFLMLLCQEHHDKKGAIIFSDAGLVIDPNSEELADIAIASANSFTALVEETPKIAMLSFSTLGSARHASVSKVIDATEKVRAIRPDILLEGELQFDAAFVPEVAASKAPGSAVAGQANVLIFPNLDAGNIGYKIAQRIGGANAIGPILQGLAHPANDLSRGCSAEDVMHMIAVTAVQ